MSENYDRKSPDFSRYNSMSTKQLEEILRLDATMPDDKESDIDELFYIMGVIAERNRNDPNFTGKTTQQAYETFKKHYMPPVSDDNAGTQSNTVKKPVLRITWLRRFTAAAAVLAILILTTISAKALGYNLWGKIAVWTDEFFQFVGETQGTEVPISSKPEELEYTSLQQALDEYNITQALAPTWLPNGYTLNEVAIMRNPLEISICAFYETSDGFSLTISVRQLLSGTPEKTEKSEGYVETYNANGISYFIFQNLDDLRVAWVVGEFECYIYGSITIEDMKDIIDSI